MTISKAYVDTDEGQIHYRYAGQDHDDPPIVLLHQTSCSARMFNEALRALADEYFVLAPDTPGAGQSYTPETVPGIEYYADVLLEALDDVGLSSYHLCGQHTGANVAVEMAIAEPARVETVSLVGPNYLDESERERWHQEFDVDVAVPPLDEDGEYVRKHWNYLREAATEKTPELRHRQLVDMLLGREGSRMAYGVVWDHDFPSRFDAVEVPRIIMAARDDILWEGFARLREDYPQVRAVELEGGNLEPIQDTENFVGALRSFIRDNED